MGAFIRGHGVVSVLNHLAAANLMRDFRGLSLHSLVCNMRMMLTFLNGLRTRPGPGRQQAPNKRSFLYFLSLLPSQH